MKHTKKFICLLLTLLMVFAMATTAFADGNTEHTITIKHDNTGHTYVGYQVFKGDIEKLDGKDVLTNIEWGEGVDGAALLTELKGLENSAYASCTSAADVAAVLKGFANNSVALDEFATIVASHLTDTVAGTSTANGTTYTITVIGDGYYFVKDQNAVSGDDAATKYILNVCGNVEITAKAETPEIDKVIVKADSANGEEGKGTAQDVGSNVEFKLTSKVPKMDGYTSYDYIVHDTLSDGLMFNNDVTVTIGESTLTKDTDYTVTVDGQSFKITFTNFIAQKANAGKEIVITYTATINEEALTTDVETNKVKLEYSNDPYNSANSHGETPEKEVYVYDFDIVIDKYADGNKATKLKDAKFVLKNSAGKYYKWNDTDKKVEWVTVETEPTDATDWETAGVTVVTTDANGVAKFQGLDSGTYYLKEVDAPAGYNLLKGEVEVKITASYNDDGTLKESSATSTNKGQYSQTAQVENKSGAQLPSTGGMGTTMFYVIGGVLVLAAVVLLVTKKRMSAKG